MTVETNIAKLGIPNIKIAGFKVWTHSRKYPEFQDFWDGNWLNTTFLCRAKGASVWVSGDILHLSEFADWLIALEKLNETISGEASLETIERYVSIRMKLEIYQRVSIKIDISPERIFQRHYFEFWLDQSCLNDLIASCRNILTEFSMRGKAS